MRAVPATSKTRSSKVSTLQYNVLMQPTSPTATALYGEVLPQMMEHTLAPRAVNKSTRGASQHERKNPRLVRAQGRHQFG
jgi:hypothetical protein